MTETNELLEEISNYWRSNAMDDIIAKIAAERGLTIVDCRLVEYHLIANEPREWFARNSYLIGATEIILGRYDGEDDIRLAAFLHEVGHLPKEGSIYCRDEREAWDEAEQLASVHGITWTPAMRDYRERCLATYES